MFAHHLMPCCFWRQDAFDCKRNDQSLTHVSAVTCKQRQHQHALDAFKAHNEQLMDSLQFIACVFSGLSILGKGQCID